MLDFTPSEEQPGEVPEYMGFRVWFWGCGVKGVIGHGETSLQSYQIIYYVYDSNSSQNRRPPVHVDKE